MKLNRKCLVLVCVDSPRVTTPHLAEYDIGLITKNTFSDRPRALHKDRAGEFKLSRAAMQVNVQLHIINFILNM